MLDTRNLGIRRTTFAVLTVSVFVTARPSLAEELVPEDTCEVTLNVPDGTRVTVDGRDYQTAKKLLFRRLKPGANYLSSFHLTFADGQTRDQKVISRGGCRVRLKAQTENSGHPTLAVQAGHSMMIRAVVFDPTGKYLLTGSIDGTARIWDMATWHAVRSFVPHEAGVLSAAFSPDGQQVLVGSWHSSATLYDMISGSLLQTFRTHEWAWHGMPVAFTPDGRYVVTGAWDGTARLWDARTAGTVRTFQGHGKWVNAAAISPDGRHLLTGGDVATLWDLNTAQKVTTFSEHTGAVEAIAYSFDGRHVLTGSNDSDHRGRELSSLPVGCNDRPKASHRRGTHRVAQLRGV